MESRSVHWKQHFSDFATTSKTVDYERSAGVASLFSDPAPTHTLVRARVAHTDSVAHITTHTHIVAHTHSQMKVRELRHTWLREKKKKHAPHTLTPTSSNLRARVIENHISEHSRHFRTPKTIDSMHVIHPNVFVRDLAFMFRIQQCRTHITHTFCARAHTH